MSLETDYRARLPALRQLASELAAYVQEVLEDRDGSRNVDLVSARAKTVESFLKKALRYNLPLEDIQDQVGVRVVVFYLRDVGPIKEHLKKFFTTIEDKKAGVKGVDTFGYEAWHCILGVPPHLQRPEGNPVEFFELQVATLFQHAYAQANHDIVYKGPAEIPENMRRYTAWASAQAYGADQVFETLLAALDQNPPHEEP